MFSSKKMSNVCPIVCQILQCRTGQAVKTDMKGFQFKEEKHFLHIDDFSHFR